MLFARLPCVKFSPLCAFDGVAEKYRKVGCATGCIGRAAAPLSLTAIKPFCRLPGANYGLVAAYDRLVGENEALRRQMGGLEGGAGSMKSALAARCCAERWRD